MQELTNLHALQLNKAMGETLTKQQHITNHTLPHIAHHGKAAANSKTATRKDAHPQSIKGGYFANDSTVVAPA